MVNLRYQRGIAYLWMLFLVFLLGLGLGKTLEVFSTVSQREKEAELLQVGRLYQEAIRQFYWNSPGSVKRYPLDLTDLIKDPRTPTTRRYLRKLYLDPISGEAFVPVMAPQGVGVAGVRSGSLRQPLKRSGFAEAEEGFENAATYADWVFMVDEG